MRHVISAMFVVLFSLAPARADESAIRDVITRQIEAFQADDLPTAFTFASPKIRAFFQNPDNFGMMVRQGYPMVWRPADVEFLSVETLNGELWQIVRMRDQAGQSHVLEYLMINGPDGWKIDAVRFRKDAEGLV